MRFVVPLLFTLILLANQTRAMGGTIPAGYYTGYDLTFSIKVVNEGSSKIDLSSNALTDPVTFLFLNNTSQTVILTSSSHKVAATIDEEENPVGNFQVDRSLGQGQILVLESNFRAFTRLTSTRRFEWIPPLEYPSSGLLRDIPGELIKKYCISAGPWRINDADPSWSSVRELALKLAGNETNALKAVSRLIEWVGENIKYPSSRKDRILFPNETLTALEGDSDEQANLIISLCRTVGIPAHLQCGYTYYPSREEKWSAYDGHISFQLDRMRRHAWAMVYIPPWGWLPVDMTIGYSEEEPLQAIQAAAAQSLGTVISNNYFVKDYVSEVNRDGEQLRRTAVRIEQRASMKPIGISSEYQASDAATLTTVLLIGFGAIILTVYVIARSRTRNRLRAQLQKA